MKRTLGLSLLLIISIFMIGIIPSVALEVPFFSQNDIRWAEDQLGGCPKWHIGWIADQSSYRPKWAGGCATTSKAMVFNYYRPDYTDPGSLNICLTENGGYARGCDAPHDDRNNICVPPGVFFAGYVKKKTLFREIINFELLAGRPVIAQVRTIRTRKIPSHFVVITGVTGSTYYINDPWDLEFIPRTLEDGALGSYTIKALWLYQGTPPVEESPWPMFGRDPQSTGQSPYTGAQTNDVKWIADIEGCILSSPTIDKDDAIYVISGSNEVTAITPGGTLNDHRLKPVGLRKTTESGSSG